MQQMFLWHAQNGIHSRARYMLRRSVTDNNCRFAGRGRAMDALSNRNERYYLFTSRNLRRRRRSLCRIPAEPSLLFLGRLLQQRQRPCAPVMRADREEHVDKAEIG